MAEIHVCTCEQCRFQKNKRGNRGAKRKIRKLMNTRRRRGDDGKIYNYYLA